MHQRSSWRVFYLSLFTFCFLLFTFSLAQDEKVIVIGHAEAAEAYDPAHAFTQTGGIINRAVYDTLVTFPDTDASSIQPLLASSWSISDDGLVYTFTLDAAAKFSNGDPVEAEDVVFSFNRLKNLKSQPSFLADPIVSVEATNASTITITLTEARPSFLSELTNSGFSVTNAEVLKANGGTDAADAAEADTGMEYLNQTSAGSGPYMLESWSPQEETVLVRNPNYWRNAPYFDRVIIVNIPEAATQKVALESGDIDLATDLSPDQMTELANNPDIGIFKGPGNATHFILMNRDPEIGGPVANPLVAKAIRHALDYEGYTSLWADSVTPGTNMWIGLSGAYGPDKAIKRDLEMAKSLLAEAGYADGFEITLSYPDFTFNGVNMNTNAQKIQADLAEVGITVNLNPGELQVSLEEYRNGQQGFGYWFWGPDKLDPVDFLEFLPGGKVATDRTRWTPEMASPEILDLIAQAKVESDPAKRAEIFIKLQDFAQEEGAFAPFNVPPTQTAFRANIQGYVWHPQWGLDIALLSRSE
jgi:peptide/nickel transport system substrate-binding protein